MKMNIFGSMNNMFGKVQPGMCRVSMTGKIAIKTNSGYKAYDVKTGKLTNCDNFAFDIGEDMFFVIPTNKVQRGDIILASGKPTRYLKSRIVSVCFPSGKPTRYLRS